MIRAESNLKLSDSNSIRERMNNKSIDDLLGRYPYLFDPGSHMDGFDPIKRKDTNN